MLRAAVLFSGGKDSVYSAYIAQQQCLDVRTTLTIAPDRPDSLMFHVPNIEMAAAVSSAMRLPNRTFNAFGAEELDVLKEVVRSADVDALITGAIASDYQTSRINGICDELDVRVFSPLWHKNEEKLLREIRSAGFRIVVIGVFANGLERDWLGRELTPEAIDELISISREKGIHVSGEGGELETMTLDGPNFSRTIEIVSSEELWKRDSGILKIHAVRLLRK